MTKKRKNVKLRKAEFEAGEQSGIQKGIQKGIQEGAQEGKELKTKEIVNSLLYRSAMGIEKISALLEISKEHVFELAGRSKKFIVKRITTSTGWFVFSLIISLLLLCSASQVFGRN